MKKTSVTNRFIVESDGSTLLEYAIIIPTFLFFFFGVIEFGLVTYHKMAIERLALEVSRAASIGTIGDSVCKASAAPTAQQKQIDYIKCLVKARSSGLINSNEIQVEVQELSNNGQTIIPDICFDDPQKPTSLPKDCTIYEDVNNDGKYNSAGDSNAGLRGETIEVRISYPWMVQLPFLQEYFVTGKHTGISMLTASTIIKNEPFR